MKKNILIAGPYLPGKSFGGPVKSLYNMVETLGDDYNFYIITGDRDLGSNVPYESVRIGEWNKVGKASVLYIPNGKTKKYLDNVVTDTKFDIIYCSSFFAKSSIIIQSLKLIKKIKVPVIVAPRGEFSQGALAIKSFKKKVYLRIYRLFYIHKKVTFTCSSDMDKKDTQKILGNSINIYKADNIVNVKKDRENRLRIKKPNEIKIATVSRIARIKNIDYSLNLLKQVSLLSIHQNIIFDIYGPIEDKEYYNECMSIIKSIDSNIQTSFKGQIDYDDVVDILSDYHVFLFPTKGENFGHVIQEALLSGCPVITSDQTPWRALKELNVGLDIPLSNKNDFIDAINYYLYMDDKEYTLQSNKAYEYGMYKVKNQLAIKEHLDMFNSEMTYKGAWADE